jgi:hypothetical protein
VTYQIAKFAKITGADRKSRERESVKNAKIKEKTYQGGEGEGSH